MYYEIDHFLSHSLSLSLLPLPPSPSSLPQQWSVYARNMIRACTGLRVLADLLNNGHDAVIRAGATALRNLAMDPRNKANLGKKNCNDAKIFV